MREISYKCDRCGKPLISRAVTKINLSMQMGGSPVEKKTFDFCSPCFLAVKSSFLDSISQECDSDVDCTESDTNEKPDTVANVSETVFSTLLSSAITSHTPTSSDETTASIPDTVTKTIVPVSDIVRSEKNADRSSMVLGPISLKDKMEILRLYVEEGLSADQIAEKMNRLPRGVKRTINSAIKSGELAILKEKQTVMYDEQNDEPIMTDEPESYSGSGASNAGIIKDNYTCLPNTEMIDGKRYDVGGILALMKAGWPSYEIAKEKHYDEAIVRVIIDKYT